MRVVVVAVRTLPWRAVLAVPVVVGAAAACFRRCRGQLTLVVVAVAVMTPQGAVA